MVNELVVLALLVLLGTVCELTLISKVAGCESKWNLAREPKTSGADQCRGCSMAMVSRTSKLQGEKQENYYYYSRV